MFGVDRFVAYHMGPRKHRLIHVDHGKTERIETTSWPGILVSENDTCPGFSAKEIAFRQQLGPGTPSIDVDVGLRGSREQNQAVQRIVSGPGYVFLNCIADKDIRYRVERRYVCEVTKRFRQTPCVQRTGGCASRAL